MRALAISDMVTLLLVRNRRAELFSKAEHQNPAVTIPDLFIIEEYKSINKTITHKRSRWSCMVIGPVADVSYSRGTKFFGYRSLNNQSIKYK